MCITPESGLARAQGGVTLPGVGAGSPSPPSVLLGMAFPEVRYKERG